MGMLNQEDLKQIGDVMDGKLKVLKTEFLVEMDGKFKTYKTEVVDEIVGQVGEMLDFNVIPQFDKVNERLDKVEASVASLETTVATLPDKDYIDQKLGGAKGKFNLARRGAGI